MQKNPEKNSVVGSDGAAAGAPQGVFSLFKLSYLKYLCTTHYFDMCQSCLAEQTGCFEITA